MERKTHTIDATGKVLGRLATEIAVLLRGKQKSDFVPYRDMGDFVIVKNVSKLKITGKKMEQKKYFHHSGFLGGVREVPLKKIFKTNPAEVLRKAVFGMLPKNKLRAEQIKRLKSEIN
ncbi:MAG: 50S ribosomal protein L13 [Candidatus Nealsonbacteria bacterium]|nr:MAG: 50S ribosomal protein L13 [Candidatus Nealsonbacteria bacterium]